MIEVRRELFDAILAYAEVPTAFCVTSQLRPLHEGDLSSGFVLEERVVAQSYMKDYDSIPGNRPAEWATHFDTENWQLFSAFEADERVGGAIAFIIDKSGSNTTQTAELWDLRVAPLRRRSGVATRLFASVESWAVNNECSALLIETQNINVAACRFYQRQGCTLHSVQTHTYPEFPDEIRLVWRKLLGTQERQG